MPLAWLVKLEVGGFLGGLAAIICYRLLTGGINTRYLFYGKLRDGTYYFSPERVQLLLFTLGVAAFYLADAITHRRDGVLPDISGQTLALLGGSHSIYLGGKAVALFRKLGKENHHATDDADS